MRSLRATLADWRQQRALARAATQATRWVVIDVETSGLDMQKDRLIAVAGVGVHWEAGLPRLRVNDTFELVLRRVTNE